MQTAAPSIPPSIYIELVYGLPDRQVLLCLQVPASCSAAEAIRLSGIQTAFPAIDLASHRIGLFGQPCTAATLLRDGDRLEIYRPLTADPKEVRRRRAAEGKKKTKAKRINRIKPAKPA